MGQHGYTGGQVGGAPRPTAPAAAKARRALALLAAAPLVLAGLLPAAAHADPPAPTSVTFSYTGAAQTWTAPAGVTSATFDVLGAQGGNALYVDNGDCSCGAALGGETTATLPVTPGQTLQVNVGGAGGNVDLSVNMGSYHGTYGSGGFNGGGSGGRDPRNDDYDGGGGGSAGVAGEGHTGTTPNVDTATISGGGAGTQTAGGAAGVSNCVPANPGTAGTKGQGGVGVGYGAGGGGGGGYYGGGGGGSCTVATGGGGGSGYSSAAGATFHAGARSGNGQVTISYTPISATTAVLLPNQQLNGNLELVSSNGGYSLQLRSDGNLVKTRQSDGRVIWMSHTTGVTRALMQSDGNFVLYDAKNNAPWATGTNNHPGAQLVLHDDGSLVVVDPSGAVLWPGLPAALQGNQSLGRDHSLSSPAGAFYLLMQDDGNLVEYRQTDNAAVWSTGSNGPATHATFQSDGNFTVADDGGKVYWASNTQYWDGNRQTWGYGPGEQLVLHDDGMLAIVDGSGAIKWSTKPSS